MKLTKHPLLRKLVWFFTTDGGLRRGRVVAVHTRGRASSKSVSRIVVATALYVGGPKKFSYTGPRLSITPADLSRTALCGVQIAKGRIASASTFLTVPL